jgi:hypothetical protein
MYSDACGIRCHGCVTRQNVIVSSGTGSAPHATIEQLLTGGHPNSLGNTPQVADRVIAGEWTVDDVIDTYGSDDAVVRLRVSNALKRVTAANPALVAAALPRLLGEVSGLAQASAQWTLAQLFGTLAPHLTDPQRAQATEIMLRNLADSDDWIVQNQTIATLTSWAATDANLRSRVIPLLTTLTDSPRGSVARRARSSLTQLSA